MDLSCRMCIENTTSLPQIFYCSHTCYCITQLGLWCSAGKSTPKSDLSQSKDIVQYVFFFFLKSKSHPNEESLSKSLKVSDIENTSEIKVQVKVN